MKLGMTGSRQGISAEALMVLNIFLAKNDVTEGHHGDCVGADLDFHNQLVLNDIRIIIHPPDNDSNRSFCESNVIKPVKPYLTRNKNIVNETDMLIAFPATKDEIIRSGTWSTIRYAKRMNTKVLIIFLDGMIEANYK
jgi:hypothetical protein